jgi:Icc-related predicted phosphoesterase
MRIVCTADTHNFTPKLPEGDLLIHAGDLTYEGTVKEYRRGIEWLDSLSFSHILFVPGNHDFTFANKMAAFAKTHLPQKVHLLIDSAFHLDRYLFYGSPWIPPIPNWAFGLDEKGREEKWSKIPPGTNVLITHTPPYAVLDQLYNGQSVGCRPLAQRVKKLEDLRLHVFGHIHSSYGIEEKGKLTFINASYCDDDYQPAGTPLVFHL